MERMDVETLLMRAEIEALSTRFGRALDGGTLEEFLSIFTEDVAYRSGPRTLAGHDDLRAFFAKRAEGGRLSRHLMSSLMVERTGPDTARGESKWLVFAGQLPAPAPGTSPYVVADVEDDYLLTEAGWKISHRTITPVFRDDGIPPPT